MLRRVCALEMCWWLIFGIHIIWLFQKHSVIEAACQLSSGETVYSLVSCSPFSALLSALYPRNFPECYTLKASIDLWILDGFGQGDSLQETGGKGRDLGNPTPTPFLQSPSRRLRLCLKISWSTQFSFLPDSGSLSSCSFNPRGSNNPFDAGLGFLHCLCCLPTSSSHFHSQFLCKHIILILFYICYFFFPIC